MEYRGHNIKIIGNILSMWDVYIDEIKQESSFLYDFCAIDYAKSLIRNDLFKK